MKYDFLLVGHGLAGAILTHTLQKRGLKVLVIDQEKYNSASNVAAGLINPVAGKRFARSWQADTFIPAAEKFYRHLETELNSTLFHQKPILKLFSSIEEQNNWMGKSTGHLNEYIEAVYPELPFSEFIHQEAGGLKITKGGFVETRKMLQLLREKLTSAGNLRSESFDINGVKATGNGIQYKEIEAAHIIFCEGYQAIHNPYFSWLPFSPNKGEVLDISLNNFPAECIYNKGVYVVPIHGNNWKVGATYNWRQPDENPTDEGRQELLQKLKQMLKLPVEISGHLAGIRPAVRDRKPLIGTHPEKNNVHIFNGMGSKGVLMAPWLAEHFADALLQQKPLLPEVDILRYQSLYFERAQ